MLRNQAWFDFCDALMIEIEQFSDEGRDVSAFAERAKIIQDMPRGKERTKAGANLLEELEKVFAPNDEKEPSGLSEIQAAAEGEVCGKAKPDFDKIYGAWLGRCAGCLLGQPVEGWRRARINGLLKETGNLPMSYYISSDISAELREKYDVRDDRKAYGANKTGWINNVSYMPEDDDTNYTLLALKLVETYGRDFTPDDAAESWLMNLPLLHLCTAERVAYINLAQSIYPPESASYRNPYREWIGAQIRGDLFGYICPGDMKTAADMAWRDASISHVKNGIYGEMWVAAMLSKAAVCDDMEEVIFSGMKQIPTESRLYAELAEMLRLYRTGVSVEDAATYILGKYDENNQHHWCHTISNAAIVVLGLLWGEKDFARTMELCLTMGFDTDCNCATAGSVLGMVLGAGNLPEEWVEPLCDTVLSGVDGFGLVKVSDMAKRTVLLAE